MSCTNSVYPSNFAVFGARDLPFTSLRNRRRPSLPHLTEVAQDAILALDLQTRAEVEASIRTVCARVQGTGDSSVRARASLAVARKQTASKEILRWMTPSEAPKAFQASERSDLLDPMRASCWISAQH